MKIKNTRANKVYLIIGRLIVNVGLYLLALQVSTKILEFVVCNCITTIK